MIPNEEKEKWHYHTVKKIGEHISCGYSMSTIWVFHKQTYPISWGRFFCTSLREHT